MVAFTAVFSGSGPYTLSADTALSTAITDTPANAVIDGLNHTITINISGFLGLFNTAVTVSNLNVVNGTGSLANYAGWFFANYIDGSATNCHSTGDIGQYGGGIFGYSAASGAGRIASATDCSSAGNIGNFGGGIFGEAAGYGGGTVSTTNCHSTVGSMGIQCGGIFGSDPGSGGTGASATATNCYSIIAGSIDYYSGGIFGSYAGAGGGCSATATNCYCNIAGNIGANCGGIFGQYAGNGGTANATNCYSNITGNIGENGGGIYGYRAAYGLGPSGSATATNCYSVKGSVFATTPGNHTTINSRVAATSGTWLDSEANLSLTGEPAANPGSGDTWTSSAANTPYALSGPPAVIVITYYPTLGDALANTNILGSSTSYTVGTGGPYGPGLGYTSWRIANNSTGSSVALSVVFANGLVLNQAGVYYMYRNTPCFLEGTKVLCLVDDVEKYIPIESMRNGTLVKTTRDGFKKVVMIAKGDIDNYGNDERIENRLYKLSPSKYPQLTEDLFITGCHSILEFPLTEKQMEDTIKHLGYMYVTDANYRLMAYIDERAVPWNSEGKYTILHFALEHENPTMNYGVYVNGGLLVETCSVRTLKNRSNMLIV